MRYSKREARQVFYLFIKFKRKSHERISGMALYNQSHLPAFFSPRKEKLKILEDDLPRMAKFQKMTFQEWPNPGR
jgi:hypothetical protein